MRRELSEIVAAFSASALLFVAGLLMLCMCSCTRTVYEPVEVVRTEYKEADTTAIYNRLLKLFESRREKETRSDSIVDRQKETVVLNANGDTTRHDTERIVYRATKHEKELEHKVKEQDSIIAALRTQLSSIKVDSIPVLYPVERKLSRWEQTKMDFGGMAIGGLLAVACVAVVWLIKKFRK